MQEATANTSPFNKQVQSLLDVFRMATKFLSDEATQSIIMHKAGINTELAQQMESIAADPMEGLLSVGSAINRDISEVMDQVIKMYFGTKSDLISEAYASTQRPLQYFLVLKKDNLKTRSEVNEFFDMYYTKDFSDGHPVMFTYTTLDRAKRIKDLKPIELHEQAS